MRLNGSWSKPSAPSQKKAMSDIVERLDKAMLYDGGGELSDMPEEAAAEIKRLRAAVDIINASHRDELARVTAEYADEIARLRKLPDLLADEITRLRGIPDWKIGEGKPCDKDAEIERLLQELKDAITASEAKDRYIKQLELQIERLRADAAAGWDKCEERRLEIERLRDNLEKMRLTAETFAVRAEKARLDARRTV
jgi:hypothetical protein